MIQLIRHHMERAGRGVPYNAIRHCHARGVHSIVLHDEPENRVRMFVTDTWHGLHNNRPNRYGSAPYP